MKPGELRLPPKTLEPNRRSLLLSNFHPSSIEVVAGHFLIPIYAPARLLYSRRERVGVFGATWYRTEMIPNM
jgi:hypothetical protein